MFDYTVFQPKFLVDMLAQTFRLLEGQNEENCIEYTINT